MRFLKDFWFAAFFAILLICAALLWQNDPAPLPPTKAPQEKPQDFPIVTPETTPSRTLSLPICYAMQRGIVLEVQLKDQKDPIRIEPYAYGLTDKDV